MYVLTGRRNQNEIVTSQLGATLNNFNQESVIPYFFYGSSQGTYVYNTIAQSFSGRARILQREPLNGFSTELADTVCSLIQGTTVPTTPSPTSKTILTESNFTVKFGKNLFELETKTTSFISKISHILNTKNDNFM